jgi:Zn finger protein HypA/HybF involved in hydrogenase expression
MHDWHLSNEILKTVLEYAIKNGLKNVSKVRLELGIIHEHGEDITPENLHHNFKLLSEGTSAEKAKLEIKKIRGDIWKIVDIEGDR